MEENLKKILESSGIFLNSGDFFWKEKDKKTKKYLLVNFREVPEEISIIELNFLFRGTGHAEWESLISIWFINAIYLALKNDKKYADISVLFQRELYASRGRYLSPEIIQNHLFRFFDIIEEDEDYIKVKFHFEQIKRTH